MVHFFVDCGPRLNAKIKYTLQLFAQSQQLEIRFVDNRRENSFAMTADVDSALPVATGFYLALDQQEFSYKKIMNHDGWITTHRGEIDYLATAFYLVNSLQEYARPESEFDEVGRFRYSHSYQCHFQIPLENRVQYCFDQIRQRLFPFLRSTPKRSRIFLTHDIDTVHGAWVQDGFHCLKRGNFLGMLRLMWNASIAKPDWLNMDQIMKLESAHDVQSTFFWLVNQGKTEGGQKNADYHINARSIRLQQQPVARQGFDNGLHKSISPDSFSTELKKLSLPAVANRNHYLKLRLPAHYDEMEASGLRLDTSLGFAEQHGFRNSYGLPFSPFNLRTDRPYTFVEAPLHLMDGTFQKYQRLNPAQTANAIGDFVERYKNNCVLTVLWHNTFFTYHKFDGYLQAYRLLLQQFKELGITSITPAEIIHQYAIDK